MGRPDLVKLRGRWVVSSRHRVRSEESIPSPRSPSDGNLFACYTRTTVLLLSFLLVLLQMRLRARPHAQGPGGIRVCWVDVPGLRPPKALVSISRQPC